MRVLDLFSGIGGFSLGLERAGMTTVAFCERDDFCRKVLRKHWPDVPMYDDIAEISRERLQADGITADVICGGWPCQTYSRAAHGNNTHPDMWPEFFRVVQDIRPRWILAENVPGLGVDGIDRVCDDLEAADYAVWPQTLDTALPERQRGRDRTIFLAHANAHRKSRRPVHEEASRISQAARRTWPTDPCPVGVADGLSNRMDRLRALGNAVVPQVVEVIGRAIMECER